VLYWLLGGYVLQAVSKIETSCSLTKEYAICNWSSAKKNGTLLTREWLRSCMSKDCEHSQGTQEVRWKTSIENIIFFSNYDVILKSVSLSFEQKKQTVLCAECLHTYWVDSSARATDQDRQNQPRKIIIIVFHSDINFLLYCHTL